VYVLLWTAIGDIVLLLTAVVYCNFSSPSSHGVASAAKRSALKNFANSRIVSGLLKGNRLPDVRQLQKSMKLLKVSINAALECWLRASSQRSFAVGGGGICYVLKFVHSIQTQLN